jgi:hypothetical protein
MNMVAVGDKLKLTIIGKTAEGWPFGFIDNKVAILTNAYAAAGDELFVTVSRVGRTYVEVSR